MGTRSRIAYKGETGIISSYVHFDGYETGVGAKLLSSYNTLARAKMVSSIGYLSGLSFDLEASMGNTVEHNLGILPVMSEDEDELLEVADGSWAEFIYLWQDEWFVFTFHNQEAGWQRLEEAVAKAMAGEAND